MFKSLNLVLRRPVSALKLAGQFKYAVTCQQVLGRHHFDMSDFFARITRNTARRTNKYIMFLAGLTVIIEPRTDSFMCVQMNGVSFFEVLQKLAYMCPAFLFDKVKAWPQCEYGKASLNFCVFFLLLLMELIYSHIHLTVIAFFIGF